MDKYYCVKRDKNIDVDIYKVCQDCYLCETFKLVRERRSKQVPDLEILDRRITKITVTTGVVFQLDKNIITKETVFLVIRHLN